MTKVKIIFIWIGFKWFWPLKIIFMNCIYLIELGIETGFAKKIIYFFFFDFKFYLFFLFFLFRPYAFGPKFPFTKAAFKKIYYFSVCALLVFNTMPNWRHTSVYFWCNKWKCRRPQCLPSEQDEINW